MSNLTAIYTTGLVRQADTSKVLRNTYMLLGLTLVFSAVCAGISLALNLGFIASLVCNIIALGLLWFALPRTANSAAGLGVVFAFTGLLGIGLGPTIGHYLHMAHGGTIVLQALGGTAVVFLGLSAYVLTTRKNFAFLGGFIAAGMMLMIAALVFALIASLLGFQYSVVNLVISGGIVLLMSAVILYQTSEIIQGGETNYILATTQLYLAIINLFTSMLQLLGAANDD